MQQWGAQLQLRGDAEAKCGGTPTAEFIIGLLAAATVGINIEGDPLFCPPIDSLGSLAARFGAAGCQARVYLLGLRHEIRRQTGAPDAGELDLARELATTAAPGNDGTSPLLAAAWPSGEPAGSLHWRFERARVLDFVACLHLPLTCAADGGASGKPARQLKSAALSCLAYDARCFAEGGREWLESEIYMGIVRVVLGHASTALADAEEVRARCYSCCCGRRSVPASLQCRIISNQYSAGGCWEEELSRGQSQVRPLR